jgi:hypothetical protein
MVKKALSAKGLWKLPGETFCEERLNQDILVVEEEHIVKMLEIFAAS